MKLEFERSPLFCAYVWTDDEDGVEHECYLDRGHEGKHACGACEMEIPHGFDVRGSNDRER